MSKSKKKFMRLGSHFFFFFCLLQITTTAQQQSDTALQRPAFIFPYRFPVFTPGVVFLRNRDTASCYLNYNYIRNEMHFIDEQGDTLILKEPFTVGKVTIGEEEFYFDKDKWVQKIQTSAGIILGYWTYSDIEANSTRSGFTGYGQVRPSQLDYSNFQLVTKDIYFIGDAYGNFIKATRNNLLAFFERHARLIKQYLSNHSVDFNKLKDLQRLLRFCETLQ